MPHYNVYKGLVLPDKGPSLSSIAADYDGDPLILYLGDGTCKSILTPAPDLSEINSPKPGDEERMTGING